MSGHSKWATIKRQKGVNDAKRGQLFTKLANAITISVKKGGGVGNPDMNPTLRIAVDKAKGANMPRENIERAIQRGAGAGAGIELDELMYEGFTPGGIGILIEAVTDKKQRTVAEIKNALEKGGGSLAGQGAVSYLFQKVGEITVPLDGKTSDEMLDFALNSGASDLEEEEGMAYIYTQPFALQKVKEEMSGLGLTIENAELVYKPSNRISVEKVIEERIIQLIERLEEMDDVQKVYTNLEFS